LLAMARAWCSFGSGVRKPFAVSPRQPTMNHEERCRGRAAHAPPLSRPGCGCSDGVCLLVPQRYSLVPRSSCFLLQLPHCGFRSRVGPPMAASPMYLALTALWRIADQESFSVGRRRSSSSEMQQDNRRVRRPRCTRSSVRGVFRLLCFFATPPSPPRLIALPSPPVGSRCRERVEAETNP